VLTLRAAAHRGFTLIEVLVAIAIIAILIMYGAPSSFRWIQNLQLRNAAESAMNGLKTARLEALRRNTTVMFEFTDPNSTAWHVCLFDLAVAGCVAAEPDIAFKTASEGAQNARFGVETTFTNFANPIAAGDNIPSRVAFDPLGRVSTAFLLPIARVDVRNPQLAVADERRLSVFVGPAGQIYMCDPALAKATNPQGCQ
jgi:type IV fimbrial biogenesis protein FimT